MYHNFGTLTSALRGAYNSAIDMGLVDPVDDVSSYSVPIWDVCKLNMGHYCLFSIPSFMFGP